jgi:hypothetical protein
MGGGIPIVYAVVYNTTFPVLTWTTVLYATVGRGQFTNFASDLMAFLFTCALMFV